MARIERPAEGTVMYSVHEHRYYQMEKRTAPFLEYVVCEAEVTGFYTKGFTEVCLVGNNPDGYRTSYRYKLSEIGTNVFYTAIEAVELAKTLTDQYDKVWGWMEEPLRRPWEDLLREGAVDEPGKDDTGGTGSAGVYV